jgi:hypothetical protein
VDDYLRVRVRVKFVTGALKLGPEFLKVIDFTVEHNPNCLVFIAKRLFSFHRQINDGQPAMSQGT